MGIHVIVHGYVECPFDFGRRAESICVFKHNRAVIQNLIRANDKHTFFERSMFTVHPPKGIVPYYESNLITFGGAYKNMYLFESDWMYEFEQLLARLCWHSASAFNEFSGIRCNWQAEQGYEHAFAPVPSPPRKWSTTFLKITEQEVPFKTAVDAGYASR
jgi:hypothetical protein